MLGCLTRKLILCAHCPPLAQTRLAVSAPGTYGGILDCVRTVARAEGAGALYKGLAPSIVGIVPYAGLDLSINSVLKDMATHFYAARNQDPGVATVLGCGMISSTSAMLGTYPLNLIRTRLQASGMPGSPTYTGAWDCFRQTVRAGGFGALYQGLLPNLLKVLPATSISYAVYDWLSKG
jgi:solute carrier family 25 phosphate transporter 23/24/25/41